MKLPCVKKLSLLQGILLSLLASFPIAAQIKPDATLPHNSLVIPKLGNVLQIDGGTMAGSNLFHSFTQFNVPTGGTAFFNNTLDVSNIFSRVTGSTVSNIDGILKANGTASLFLLNPNGIIFGKNAQLNIGGSFLGTTATSIKFTDGTQFSAIGPTLAPLLTVSVPVGLGFGSNPGTIRVQGTRNSISYNFSSPTIRGSNSTGLQVSPGKVLALIGGDIALEGGIMIAESGQIELGSVGEGVVSLIPTNAGWTFGYEGVSDFKDIQLSQRALVDASGNGSGSIQVQGRNVSLLGGSVILIQNQGSQPANKISVNASESLEVNGSSPGDEVRSIILAETLGGGNGGGITVFTKRLFVQNGGDILTKTFSAAKGGDLTVNAIDSIKLSGFSPINYLTSNISSYTFSSGNTGNVAVSTGLLSIEEGGAVGASTSGTGSAGNLTVNAVQSIELIGVNPISFAPSNLGAVSFNTGNAGKLIVNTSRLVLRDGGRADSATLASGNAGSVTINATDSVEVTGTVPGSINPSLIDSSANITDPIVQKLIHLPPVPSGASGDVTINTGRLIVTNGGLVNVRNDGIGNAGNLIVNANSISVDNSGGITATTASGSGGNITIKTNSLQLRHNSPISATAGNNGNGGNLSINTNTIVALENSNITANGYGGRGGNITINTQGIFRSPDIKITASSAKGVQFNGVVNINTPGIDPSRGLVNLPAAVVDTSSQIAQGCSTANNSRSSRFVVTRNGGLPPNPAAPLSADAVIEDVRLPPMTTAISPSNSVAKPLVEATGWVVNEKGEVVLVAQMPTTGCQSP